METNQPQATVLIVDDTPGNLSLLSDTLAEANYRVLVATDGLSALEQIQYIQPDIILLDVLMPGIDGFETCSRLKANPRTEAIPVLFMTGLSELDHLLRGFDEGALDYIVKPIRPAEVLARIAVHLSQTRNLRRAERLLEEGAFAALAVDSAGRIRWLTPAGADWLLDFNGQADRSSPSQVGEFIPGPLLDWFLAWRDHSGYGEADYAQQLTPGFSVSVSPCERTGEYLLVLQRNESESQWGPEALRDKLKLTFREAEILMWIARGKTNKEIGQILNSSPRTINKHLEHVFEKLGVSTRAAAVAIALQPASSGSS